MVTAPFDTLWRVTVATPFQSSRDTPGSGVHALAGFRIVLVDDDPDARDLLATVLVQRSAEVFAASSAPEAFALLKEHRPDVLISDIAMPEEDGYMLIRRVRALGADEGGLTPAVAVTAYAGRADRRRALEAGFDDHYAKPIDLDKLVERLVEIRNAAP